MSDDDKKVSERYRELPREEPPRALDDAILAASRRAVQARPAPLVAPTGRRRWYVPLAAAAVITLAVAVTLHVQRDRPDEEADAGASSMRIQQVPPPEALQKETAKAEAPKPATAPKAEEERRRPERRAQQPFARAPATDSVGPLAGAPAVAPSEPAPAAPPAARTEPRERNDAAAASAGVRAVEPAAKPAPAAPFGVGAVAGRLQAPTPESELERIAELRRLGRHEEADKALIEFRKRYPDYKIPGAMLERVERR